MPITLAFVALSCGTDFEKKISMFLLLLLSLFFDFVNCGDHTMNTTFRVLTERIMIWNKLLILVMISSVGWDSIVWFEGVSLVDGDESVDLRS